MKPTNMSIWFRKTKRIYIVIYVVKIDLVYEHAGKYYVVDYKSNFLGNSLSDYNEATLK